MDLNFSKFRGGLRTSDGLGQGYGRFKIFQVCDKKKKMLTVTNLLQIPIKREFVGLYKHHIPSSKDCLFAELAFYGNFVDRQAV